MKIKNCEVVEITLDSGIYRLASVDPESGQHKQIHLTVYQAELVSKFIVHNMPIAIEQDVESHDLNDREPHNTCRPDFEVLFEAARAKI